MDAKQNSTEPKSEPIDIQQSDDARYQLLIDYKATNGLITDEEGGMKKMPMQGLANALRVDRGTLYNWMQREGFWDAVNERRKELSPKSRLARVHETWYLKAAAGEFQHMQLWLANFDPSFVMPNQKLEVDVGDAWAQLMQRHIGEGRSDGVIEGEVVNDGTANG